MEYDKFLISLYKRGENLPKHFVSIKKSGNNLRVKLEPVAKLGLLIVISDDLCCFEIKNNVEINLNDKFNFKNDYFICYFDLKYKYYGKRSKQLFSEQIYKKFDELCDKYLAEKEIEKALETDRNFVCDKIIYKMFGAFPSLYFENTKNQLYQLFAVCDRAPEIENIIKCSKFIKTGTKNHTTFFGIVYKNNLPFAIAMGQSVDNLNVLKTESNYQLFYDNNQSQQSNQMYLISFRRASDGDEIWIK